MMLTLKEAGKSFTLCGSMSGERETVAYMSTSERLTVSVISRNDADVPRNFLLNYTGTARRRRLAHDSHTHRHAMHDKTVLSVSRPLRRREL